MRTFAHTHSGNWLVERGKFVDKVASLVEGTTFQLPSAICAVEETPDRIQIGWKRYEEDDEALGILKNAPMYEPESREPTIDYYEINHPTDEQRQRVREECDRMNQAYRCGLFILSGLEVV